MGAKLKRKTLLVSSSNTLHHQHHTKDSGERTDEDNY